MSCGLVGGYHCLGGSKGEVSTPATASVPVYQCLGDCEISTVIIFFHNIVCHSALSFVL